ncbi:hypothetical protein VNO80_12034 [Phaseolus coccineus]|uniref:VQ domain-containing protein n=1 Tax=Phaseolus coccineus TaxID=3886 RepID=A0AAN9NBI0_PHACN
MTPKTRVQGPLKINKESQWIKKSPVSKVQHKEPVIIYTQSPRIIQTHARHFMELVQKLTGIYHSDLDDTGVGDADADADAFKPATPSLLGELEENEAAASVITEEEDSCNSVGEVKSSFMALEPSPMPDYVKNFAVFESDFLNANPNQPLLHFADPLLSL